MASIRKLEVDMNDPSTLAFYSNLLLFKNDISQTIISFDNPTKPEQRILQSLAHALELEYDHNTLVRRAYISRAGVWQITSETPGNAATDFTKMLIDVEENQLSNTNHTVLNDFIAEQPTSDASATEFMHSGLASPGIASQEGRELDSVQLFDWYDGVIENMPASQIEQDQMLGTLDDVSVDYSIDTIPSRSETSAIAQISSASDLYSNHDFSSHNLHGGHLSSSSIADVNNLRGSCQSIHAAISGFFGGSHRITSRAASNNSMHSEWARNRIEKSCSRRSSVRSAASSGLLCFDSRSNHSGSQVSLGSGRRGPLGKISRATMRAVTAVKACWRCKILRKGCNPETPCDTCPKDTHRSDWHSVGCRRGDIKDHMLPVALCWRRDERLATEFEDSSDQSDIAHRQILILANDHLERGLEERQKEIWLVKSASSTHKTGLLGDFLGNIGMDLHTLDSLRGTPVLTSSLGQPSSPSMAPLDDCILMMVWELLSNPRFQSIHDGWSVHELFNFLIAAGLCQIDTGNRLIAQSFICLRSTLEVLRIQASTNLDDSCHRTCNTALCNVECIDNLETHLSHYLDELSRVFFTKENMRDIKIWWMSGFYSLCIQGIVRRALMQIISFNSIEQPAGRILGAQQYLQVAVRLFAANSRIHDPLVRDLPQFCEATCTEEELWKINECKLAQSSVKQYRWKASGIKGSGDYLKRLFEDNDQPLLTTTAEAGSGELCPEIDATFKPYSWITKFTTVFLIADTKSMLENGYWNEISGVLSSIMFLINRYHNYGVDIHFENHRSLSQGGPLEGTVVGGYYNVKNIATVTEIFKKIKPAGSTQLSARLGDILKPQLAKLEAAIARGEELKPLNLIVITDDVREDEIRNELFSTAKRLDEMNAPRQQVAVQCFIVGNNERADTLRSRKGGSKQIFQNPVGARDIVSRVACTEDEQLSGEGILKTNLEAWLKILEAQ